LGPYPHRRRGLLPVFSWPNHVAAGHKNNPNTCTGRVLVEHNPAYLGWRCFYRLLLTPFRPAGARRFPGSGWLRGPRLSKKVGGDTCVLRPAVGLFCLAELRIGKQAPGDECQPTVSPTVSPFFASAGPRMPRFLGFSARKGQHPDPSGRIRLRRACWLLFSGARGWSAVTPISYQYIHENRFPGTHQSYILGVWMAPVPSRPPKSMISGSGEKIGFHDYINTKLEYGALVGFIGC
jgi:hypothetical protein